MIRLELDTKIVSRDVSRSHVLIQSFKRAAPFETAIPEKPLEGHDAAVRLSREVWLQTRDALTALLHRNYPVGEKKLWEKIYIQDSGVMASHTRFFRVGLRNAFASDGEKFEISTALGDFADNFTTASHGVPNVWLADPISPDLLCIGYLADALLEASKKILYSFHSDDGEAWAHLQSAMHVFGRIETPAHKLN